MLEKINDWHIFDILYEIMNMKLLKVKVFINIFSKKKFSYRKFQFEFMPK